MLKQRIPDGHRLKETIIENESSYRVFKEHPLIKILDGHPRTIILASSLLERKSLSNIFHDFLSNSKDEVATELIEESLKSSRAARELFMFLPMLPTGATESQL